MDDWYYKRADAEFGPISDAELRALLERENNAAEIQIRRNASEAWVPAVADPSAVAAPLAVPPPPASLPPPLPPPLPSQPGPAPALLTPAGPTAWLWFSSMLLALDLIALAFMQLVFFMYALFLVAGITGLPDWFTSCVDALDTRVLWPQIAMFLLLVLWQGCAFGSILKLYPHVRIEHGRASGFWWITPVANLFMPFFCLRELRWASRKQRKSWEVGITAGALIWLIVGVFVLRLLAAVFQSIVEVARSANTEVTNESTTTLANATNLAFNFFGLCLSILLTVFVLRNLVHQIRLYRGWTPPEAAL
jgi:hypothetical protein